MKKKYFNNIYIMNDYPELQDLTCPKSNCSIQGVALHSEEAQQLDN